MLIKPTINNIGFFFKKNPRDKKKTDLFRVNEWQIISSPSYKDTLKHCEYYFDELVAKGVKKLESSSGFMKATLPVELITTFDTPILKPAKSIHLFNSPVITCFMKHDRVMDSVKLKKNYKYKYTYTYNFHKCTAIAMEKSLLKFGEQYIKAGILELTRKKYSYYVSNSVLAHKKNIRFDPNNLSIDLTC